MEMVEIISTNTLRISGYTFHTKFEIRQYYEFSEVFVTREEDSMKNNYLFAYGYSKDQFAVKWEFPFNNVSGIRPIIPETKKEKEFISKDYFNQYLDKFKGKELLEVYAGEFRYLLNPNTGEIYSKFETR